MLRSAALVRQLGRLLCAFARSRALSSALKRPHAPDFMHSASPQLFFHDTRELLDTSANECVELGSDPKRMVPPRAPQFFFHNARELLSRGSGPYFYL